MIRPARWEDVPAILAISNAAAATSHANFAVEPESLEAWQEAFNEVRFPWYVAEDVGAILGFAKSGPHEPDHVIVGGVIVRKRD